MTATSASTDTGTTDTGTTDTGTTSTTATSTDTGTTGLTTTLDAPTNVGATIDLGTTTIGDVYTLPGHPADDRLELFGYVDRCSSTAFLPDDAADAARFCGLVNAHRDGSRLRIPNGRGLDEYEVRDLAHLDLHLLITTTALYGVRGAACVNTPNCIPLFNGTALVGSYRTHLSTCISTPGQFCVAFWRNVTVDLFPNLTCRPRSTPTALTIAFC